MTDEARQHRNRKFAEFLRGLPDAYLRGEHDELDRHIRLLQGRRALLSREIKRRKRAKKSIPPAEPASRGEPQ